MSNDAPPTPTGWEPLNWTCDLAGMSNSSERFEFLCKEVEQLIRDDAHMLIAGRADMTARLIMAQLAHKYGLRPTPGWKLEEE